MEREGRTCGQCGQWIPHPDVAGQGWCLERLCPPRRRAVGADELIRAGARACRDFVPIDQRRKELSC